MRNKRGCEGDRDRERIREYMYEGGRESIRREGERV